MDIQEGMHDLYEEQEYKGNSQATRTFYRQHLDHFLKDTGISELSEFTESTIRQWLSPWIGRGIDRQSKNPSATVLARRTKNDDPPGLGRP